MSNDKTKPLTLSTNERVGKLIADTNKPGQVFELDGFRVVAIPGGLRITAPSGKRIDVLGMVMSEDKRELEVRLSECC